MVEAGDFDLAVGPCQARQDRGQRIERVGDGAAVCAGVQIAVGPLDQDLEVRQSLEAVGDRGDPRRELAGVGDDGIIALQPLVVLAHVGFEAGPPDFFLTLDQDLDIDRQRARCLEPRLDGLQMSEHLALVVGGSPGIEVAVLDRWLKRR